jgi:hypothetical protein
MATTGGSRRKTRSTKAAAQKTLPQVDEPKAGEPKPDGPKLSEPELSEPLLDRTEPIDKTEQQTAEAIQAATEATEAAAIVEETVTNAVEVEEIMAEQAKATSNGEASKPGKLELTQKPEQETNGHSEAEAGHEHGLVFHGQGSAEIEIAESFTSAGLRPIGASHLEIFGMILNNRPITASHLHVLEYSLPGGRPIFAGDIVVCDDLTLPGGRPIVASDPHLLDASMIMGGRPIASNDIDDAETLMGFLD